MAAVSVKRSIRLLSSPTDQRINTEKIIRNLCSCEKRKESLKKFNDQLPVGLLPQLVGRALHWYRSGQVSKFSLTFFRLSFRSCISYVFYCDDLLYSAVISSSRISNIWKHIFIISDQLISTIPYKVYSQLVLLLARDRINIASRIFDLTLEEAIALKDLTEHSCNSMHTGMDAVFRLMSERQVRLGELVEVLKEINRYDAISVLTEAGYPEYTLGNYNLLT